jgi:hypothetical protein
MIVLGHLRHLALLVLALGHLISRQATRKRHIVHTKKDILYTCSVVAFGLALSLCAEE